MKRKLHQQNPASGALTAELLKVFYAKIEEPTCQVLKTNCALLGAVLQSFVAKALSSITVLKIELF